MANIKSYPKKAVRREPTGMEEQFLPPTINLNLDVPIELKASDRDLHMMYQFNFTNKIARVYTYTEEYDNTRRYHEHGVFPIAEISGGLAYFDMGWRIFGQEIQEKYAEYVAENEILGGKDE